MRVAAPIETKIETNLHATVIALGARAALIRGPSGSGKSDLALRAILAAPVPPLLPEAAVLVADDQVLLSRDGAGLLVRCPPSIAGRIEVRGLGILDVPHRPQARAALVVSIAPRLAIDRMPPADACTTLMDVSVPHLTLDPFEASAHWKLLLALAQTTQ